MFKDETYRKHMLEDIKTIFDGIRCIGLCAAMALGLQWLQEPMISAGFSYLARGMVNFLGLTISGVLTAAALFWTFLSLKTEPRSKTFHRISVFFLILITLTAVIAVVFSSYKNAPFALLG